MTTDINIKEVVEDKSSLFNVKRFKIKNLDFSMPKKSIPLPSNLSKTIFDKYYKDNENEIYETSKDFSLLQIKSLLTTETSIGEKLGWKRWKSENKKFIIVPFFDFNPFKHFKNLDFITPFFDAYHSFSNFILLIPNLKYKFKNPNTNKNEIITSFEDYCKFVKESYEILSYKNGKPIFVPISLRFNLTDLKKLIDFYVKNEYYYFWIDFEKNSLSEERVTKIKTIMRELQNTHKVFDKVIFYYSNNKKDIQGNNKEDLVAASDVLLPVFGANIVGINKSRAFYNSKEDKNTNAFQKQKEEEELFRHSGRILDVEKYYYVKPELKFTLPKEETSLINARRLNDEFKATTKDFLEEMTIRSHIEKKEMMTKYRDGRWLNLAIEKKKEKSYTIDEFF